MTEEIAEKLTSSVRDLRDEDNQRRADDLRALRERQVPETTQPPTRVNGQCVSCMAKISISWSSIHCWARSQDDGERAPAFHENNVNLRRKVRGGGGTFWEGGLKG